MDATKPVVDSFSSLHSHLSAFTILNWAFSGALMIIFLVLVVLGDRQRWIQADMFLSAGFGLFISVCPRCYLEYQTEGTLDEASITATRVLGCVVIGTVLVNFLTRETRDGTVPISLMMSRIFSLSIVLLCQWYTEFWTTKGKKELSWSNEHMYFGMFGIVLWIVGNLIYSLRSHDFSSYPQHNIRINEVLRFEGLIDFIIAVAFIAFPDVFLKGLYPKLSSPNCVAVHAVRCIGAFGLFHCFTALQACGFLHEKDKKAYFQGRLVAYCLVFLPLVVVSLTWNEFSLTQLVRLGVCSLIVPILSVAGLLVGGTIYYRPSVREKYT